MPDREIPAAPGNCTYERVGEEYGHQICTKCKQWFFNSRPHEWYHGNDQGGAFGRKDRPWLCGEKE